MRNNGLPALRGLLALAVFGGCQSQEQNSRFANTLDYIASTVTETLGLSSPPNPEDCRQVNMIALKKSGAPDVFFNSIQSAIEKAEPGTEILIGRGRYLEDLRIESKSNIVVRASCEAEIQSLSLLRSSNLTVQGLNVRPSGESLDGIRLGGGEASNRDIRLVRNEVSGARYGIAITHGNKNVFLIANHIHENRTGVGFLNHDGLEVEELEASSEATPTNPAILPFIAIEGNLIRANKLDGISLRNDHFFQLKGNVILDNGADATQAPERGRYALGFGINNTGHDLDDGGHVDRKKIQILDNIILDNRGTDFHLARSSKDIGGFKHLLDSQDSGNVTTNGTEGQGVSKFSPVTLRHVFVDVREVQFVHEDGSYDTLTTLPGKYDLTTLRFDLSRATPQANVPKGEYKEVRLYLNPGGQVVTSANQTFPILAKPGRSNAFSIRGKFVAEFGKQVQLVFGFKVEECIRHNNSGYWIFSGDATVEKVAEVDKRYLASIEKEALLQLNPISDTELAAFLSAYGLTEVAIIPGINTRLVRVRYASSFDEILANMAGDPRVSFVEPNFVSRVFANSPNDPSYPQQWSLGAINVVPAWSVTKGADTLKIAVLDTGINTSLFEFTGRVASGFNFVDNTGNFADDNGHGTAVSSVIAANVGNAVGIAGINWNSKLVVAKVLDRKGSGNYHDLAQGILYAVDQGAKVINISAGGYGYSRTLEEAVNYAVQHDVIVVAAAGNDGSPFPVYPASLPGVINVAASDQDNLADSQSNYGTTVDLMAPGVRIPVLGLQGGVVIQSGSSLAAPHVAAIASLLRSQEPGLTADQITSVLVSNADASISSDGNSKFGAGRVNAVRSMNALHPVTMRDLSVASGRVIGIIAQANHPNTLEIVVQNAGTATSSNSVVVEEVAGLDVIQIGRSDVSLMAGQRTTLSFQYAPLSGSALRTIRARLTATDDNGSNDALAFEISCLEQLGRDLALGNVSGSLISADDSGETIKVVAQIKNQGPLSIGPYRVDFWAMKEQRRLGSAEMPGLAVGEESIAEVVYKLPKTVDGKSFLVQAMVAPVQDEVYVGNNTSIGKLGIEDLNPTSVKAYYYPRIEEDMVRQAIRLVKKLPLNAEGRSFFEKYGEDIGQAASLRQREALKYPTPRKDKNINQLPDYWDADAGDFGRDSSYTASQIDHGSLTSEDLEYLFPGLGLTFYLASSALDPLLADLGLQWDARKASLTGYTGAWGTLAYCASGLGENPPDVCVGSYIPNAWQQSRQIWGGAQRALPHNGVSPTRFGPYPTAGPFIPNTPAFTDLNRSVLSLDPTTDGSQLALRLGMVAHFLVETTMPTNAHLDLHPDWEDDSFNDWLDDIFRPDLFYVNEGGTDTRIYTAYKGESEPPFFGKGDPIFGDPSPVDEPYLKIGNGMVYLNDPNLFRPNHPLGNDNIPADVYPLYFYMYLGNQKGDYFASDNVDGDPSSQQLDHENIGDRRRRWVGFAGFPNSPRTKQDIADNDCHNEFLGVCLNSGDTDYDGDLYRIAQFVYTYSIRSVASTYCHYSQMRGWVPNGTCPIDSGPYTYDFTPARVDEQECGGNDYCRHVSGYVSSGAQSLTVEFLWSDNQGDSYGYVPITGNTSVSVNAGDFVEVAVWKDEYAVGTDDFGYEVWINHNRVIDLKFDRYRWGSSLIKLYHRDYVPKNSP